MNLRVEGFSWFSLWLAAYSSKAPLKRDCNVADLELKGPRS